MLVLRNAASMIWSIVKHVLKRAANVPKPANKWRLLSERKINAACLGLISGQAAFPSVERNGYTG
jgi:hypothetical protein